MTKIIKLLTDEDDDQVLDPVWCFVEHHGESPRAFCSGQVFGEGESDVEYKLKTVKRGGITCKQCLERIKAIKNVRL